MRRVLIAAAMALLLTLTACGGSSPSSPSGGSQTLKVGFSHSLSTGDPSMTGLAGDMALLNTIYDPLTRWDNEGKLHPWLATSWHLLSPTTWEFKLRTGVTFQDGEPFNADAARFSIDRIITNPRSPIQELRSIDHTAVKDPSTLDIFTRYPDPMIPDVLALFGGEMVPPTYIQQHGADYFAAHPIGTGPYQVTDWVRDDHMTLAANKDYWGSPRPSLKTVTVRFITDPTTRMAALLNHEVDFIDQVPTAGVNQLKGSSNLRLDSIPGLRFFYVSIATKDGPLANPKVRQALSYATDTRTLIDKIQLGYGVQLGALVPRPNFGWDVAPRPWPYDPKKAKQLLAEAGYPNGFSTEFDCLPDIYTTIAQSVAQMWAQVGVTADVKTLPTATFTDGYVKGTLPAVYDNGSTQWQGDPTPLIDTFFHTGRPRARVTSPQLDQMDEQLRSETDPSRRRADIQQTLSVIHDAAPWIYLFQADDLYGVSSAVHWTPPRNGMLSFNTISMS